MDIKDIGNQGVGQIQIKKHNTKILKRSFEVYDVKQDVL
jgi:hypothetical protein